MTMNSEGDRTKAQDDENAANPGMAEQGPRGEQSHGGSEGEALYGYGRHGGSIAGTGTRTDVPVGIEQIESSEAYKVSGKEALERQGDPLPRTSGQERGVAGSTEDDIAHQ